MTTEIVPGRGDEVRHPEIDWIKAVAIVTVVLIHSLPPFYANNVTPLELWLGSITRFAVPGFLFASGFLYAGSVSRNWPSAMGRRLRRLLVPYVLFSILALLFHPRAELSDLTVVGKLLFGAALGEYYYIFVIFWMILAVPLVERIPRAFFPGIVLLSLFVQWGFETGSFVTLSPFWSIRNPARWLATFLLGWWMFQHRVAIRRVIEARRATCVAALGALWVGLAIGMAGADWFSRANLQWLQIYTSLGIIYAASSGSLSAPRFVRWLSDVSYSIYLSHLFFVDPVLRAIPRLPGGAAMVSTLAAWLAGLVGGASFAAAARFILGERRARAYFG